MISWLIRKAISLAALFAFLAVLMTGYNFLSNANPNLSLPAFTGNLSFAGGTSLSSTGGFAGQLAFAGNVGNPATVAATPPTTVGTVSAGASPTTVGTLFGGNRLTPGRLTNGKNGSERNLLITR